MSSSYETVQITGLGTSAAPQAYTVAPSQIVELLAISATFDGSGAGGSFVPCVQIITDSGHLLGTCVAASANAGDVVEATFAPFLRSQPAKPAVTSALVPVDYVEITTDNTAPSALISSGTITVAAPTDVFLVHLYAPAVLNDSQGQIQFHFKAGVTDYGLVGMMQYLLTSEVFQPLSLWRRITGLAAGTTSFHIYTTTSGAGTWVIKAGDGTSANNTPAFLETFRVVT